MVHSNSLSTNFSGSFGEARKVGSATRRMTMMNIPLQQIVKRQNDRSSVVNSQGLHESLRENEDEDMETS